MASNVSVQIESVVPKEIVRVWSPRTVAWYGVLLGFPAGLVLAVRNWKAMRMDRQVHRHVIGGFLAIMLLIPVIIFVPNAFTRALSIGLTIGTYAYLKATFISDIATAQSTYDVRYRSWYSGFGWALFGLLIFFSLIFATLMAIAALGFNVGD